MIEWFGWHNGSSLLKLTGQFMRALPPTGYELLSLEQSVELRQEQRLIAADIAQDAWEGPEMDPDYLWDPGWVEIACADDLSVVAEASEGRDECRVYVGAMMDENFRVPKFQSLAEFVGLLSKVLDVYVVPGDERIHDKLPLELQLTWLF